MICKKFKHFKKKTLNQTQDNDRISIFRKKKKDDIKRKKERKKERETERNIFRERGETGMNKKGEKVKLKDIIQMMAER